MSGDTFLTIGELSGRTGLTVKAVRYYADRGIVPPAGRSAAGHRRWTADAVARLELVRTLRELGIDLATVRRVVDGETTLAAVAATHADALAVQIRTLRLRRVVLSSAARQGSTAEEMSRMHELARLTGDERRRLTDAFLGDVFGDLQARPELRAVAGTMRPELPDSPEPEQIEAWVAVAQLYADAGFRARLRAVAEQHAADRSGNPLRRDPVAAIRDLAGPALAAGVHPASTEADAVVTAVTADYAVFCARPDDDDLRRRLLARLAAAGDERREQYLTHLSVINGWPPPASVLPVLDWFGRALTARLADR